MSTNKWEETIKYRLTEIELWAMDGVSEKEIAERLDISYRNFRNHKNEHVELQEALKMTKNLANLLVKKSLLKNALGQTLKEELHVRSKTGKVVLKEIKRRELPGNVSAQKLWLESQMKESFGKEGDSGGGGKVIFIDES